MIRVGFSVAWEDHARGGSFPAISGRFFDSTGTAVGPDFQINTYSSGQSHADIALNRDGDFLVVWSSDNQDGSGEGIFAQRFGSSGGRIGGEFQVNTYTQGRQLIASAGAVGNGFVIAWNSRSQDGDGYGIFARHLVDGTPSQASEFQVTSHTLGNQSLSDVACRCFRRLRRDLGERWARRCPTPDPCATFRLRRRCRRIGVPGQHPYVPAAGVVRRGRRHEREHGRGLDQPRRLSPTIGTGRFS